MMGSNHDIQRSNIFMGLPGRLVALEGPDGSGKTTAKDFIADLLKERGYDVVLTREPGGTPIAEKIRSLLLSVEDGYGERMLPGTEAALFAAARHQHIFNLIIPAMVQGKIVITDRFFFSSYAYQGFGRNQMSLVSTLHDVLNRNAMPDNVLYFDVSQEISKARLLARGNGLDRLDAEEDAFKERVNEGYRSAYDVLMSDVSIFKVDAEKPLENVFGQLTVWADIYFPSKGGENA